MATNVEKNILWLNAISECTSFKGAKNMQLNLAHIKNMTSVDLRLEVNDVFIN